MNHISLALTRASTSVAGGDVTPPTLVSATIPAGTGTQVNLVFNEPIQSTLGLPAKWVTSGHTYTAITYVDSTHAYLTTSTTFAFGDTPVLAYTTNGTNDIKDIAGNAMVTFSGKSIVNNLVSSSIQEDFTRSDSTSVMGHLQTWTQHAGVWGTSSNRGYNVNLDGTRSYATFDTGLGGVGMAVSFKMPTTNGTGDKNGLIFGILDSGISGFVALIGSSDTGSLNIYNWTGSAINLLQTGASSLYVAGDVLTVKKDIASGNITVFNGATQLTALNCNFGAGNSTVFGTGRVGLYAETLVAGTTFDDILVTPFP